MLTLARCLSAPLETDHAGSELLWYMQARGEQLAEEHAELVALRHELNQRDRELSRRATEQATEAANTQVCYLCWLPCQVQETQGTSACSPACTRLYVCPFAAA